MELSHSVLQHFGSLRALLSADKEAFCKVKGLGITQFIQLQATTEMTKALSETRIADRTCI